MEIQLPAEQDYTPALVPAVGPGYDGCLFLQLIYAATTIFPIYASPALTG